MGENGNDGVSLDTIPELQPIPGQIFMFPTITNISNIQINTGTWLDARQSVGFAGMGLPIVTNAAGPEIAFARTLIAQGYSQKVGIVAAAFGATGLWNCWMPAHDCYVRMVNAVKYAMASASEPGQLNIMASNVRLKGMLWVQGETDGGFFTGSESPFSIYAANFAKFVSAMRADLSAYNPKLPVIMAVMSTKNRDILFPNIATVRQQQQSIQVRN